MDPNGILSELQCPSRSPLKLKHLQDDRSAVFRSFILSMQDVDGYGKNDLRQWDPQILAFLGTEYPIHRNTAIPPYIYTYTYIIYIHIIYI
jgi:hypothetical protein